MIFYLDMSKVRERRRFPFSEEDIVAENPPDKTLRVYAKNKGQASAMFNQFFLSHISSKASFDAFCDYCRHPLDDMRLQEIEWYMPRNLEHPILRRFPCNTLTFALLIWPWRLILDKFRKGES